MKKIEIHPMDDMKEKTEGTLDDYEIKEAMDVLVKAEEVKENEQLFSAAKKQMSKKQNSMQKITSLSGLKDAAKKRIKEIETEES